jgi:hypothetical protein
MNYNRKPKKRGEKPRTHYFLLAREGEDSYWDSFRQRFVRHPEDASRYHKIEFAQEVARGLREHAKLWVRLCKMTMHYDTVDVIEL